LSGLYSICFDENPYAHKILDALGVSRNDIDRYRDCGLTPAEVWVYARTGGGNRKDYPNAALTGNKYYKFDVDDSYDKTYSLYYFNVPEGLHVGHKDVPDWAGFFARMDQDPEFKKQQMRRFLEKADQCLTVMKVGDS
jgi:hypothetical protein